VIAAGLGVLATGIRFRQPVAQTEEVGEPDVLEEAA
jgi:hypothetical protein